MLSTEKNINTITKHEKTIYFFMLLLFMVTSLTPLKFYPYELTSSVVISGSILGITYALYLILSIFKSNPQKTYYLNLKFPIIILAVICLYNFYDLGYNIESIYILNLIILFHLLKSLINDGLFNEFIVKKLIIYTFLFELFKWVFIFSLDIKGFIFTNNNITAIILVMGLPIIFYKSKLSNFQILITYLLGSVVVFLLNSRSGLIGMFSILAITMYFKNKGFFNIRFSAKLSMAVFSLMFVLSMLTLMINKNESTEGRIIIWKNSIEIVQNQPLFGHGIGSFKKQFGIQLSDYFTKTNLLHEKDNFTRQITIAHNDLLQLIIECGILGALFLASLIWELTTRQFDGYSLVIGVFLIMGITNSVFYIIPCGYLLIIGLVFFHKGIVNLECNKYFYYAFGFIMSILTAYTNIKYERAIRETKNVARNNRLNDSLEALKPFQKILKNSDYYWLHVAEIFYKKGQYKNASMACKKAINIGYDKNAFNLLASINMKEDKSDNAERYLKKVHYIAPGLIRPKYNLFEYYKRKKDINDALKWAKEVTIHKQKGTKDIKHYKEQANIFIKDGQ